MGSEVRGMQGHTGEGLAGRRWDVGSPGRRTEGRGQKSPIIRFSVERVTSKALWRARGGCRGTGQQAVAAGRT